MTSPAIINSLLRLNGIAGEPPLPFERPNDKMDFFVLELGWRADVETWCAHTIKVLNAHAKFLRHMHAAGAK